jgi:hypothetical protein
MPGGSAGAAGVVNGGCADGAAGCSGDGKRTEDSGLGVPEQEAVPSASPSIAAITATRVVIL